jgi:hypothetical protein
LTERFAVDPGDQHISQNQGQSFRRLEVLRTGASALTPSAEAVSAVVHQPLIIGMLQRTRWWHSMIMISHQDRQSSP